MSAIAQLKLLKQGFSFTNTTPGVKPTRSNEYTLGTNPIACAAPAVANDAFVLDMATSTVAFGKGFCFTNATPSVKANRSNSFTLGTNPIACAACGVDDDKFVLDMATATVAHGKVEVNARKGMSIPNGWGADKNGKETNDPKLVLDGGGLLPLGGSEESGGYKGYGLAMMVEVLCGIMAGSAYSTNVRRWGTTKSMANLGQCFIAVNPAMFADGFEARVQDLMNIHRNLTPAEPDKPVLVAGDPERNHIKKCDELGGIPYPVNVVTYMNNVAKKLNVEPM